MAAKAGDKIEKIIARLQGKIAEGQFYEAQQQTRVVAARYVKAENWSAAIDILAGVAQSLQTAMIPRLLFNAKRQSGRNRETAHGVFG